jgi:HEAT repeat protein
VTRTGSTSRCLQGAVLLLVVIELASGCLRAVAVDSTVTRGRGLHRTALERLLAPLTIAPDELGIRELNYARDSWRLRVVDHLLARPLDAVAIVRGLAGGLRATRGSLADLIRTGGRYLDLRPPAVAEGARTRRPLTDVLRSLQSDGGIGLPPDTERQVLRLPLAVRPVVADLLDAMAVAAPMVRHASAALTEADRVFLIRALGQGPERETLDETDTWRLLALSARVDRPGLLAGALVIAAAIDRARAALVHWRGEGKPGLDSRNLGSAWPDVATGDVRLAVETSVGLVVVGGDGPTTYRRDAALIIDLGGDDRYDNRAGGTAGPEQPISIVIDLDGDDTYASSAKFSQGAAAFGVGVLLDLAGDDTYAADDVGQGAGLFGVGILVDVAGNDAYDARRFGQGAALFGMGALIDDAGQDRYRATTSAQGFGATGGLGVLLDEVGDDTYLLAGGPADFREPDQAQSFGQGFAIGLRPLASGGIGLLADHAGNDRYTASYFAQGASYWLGLGGLVDDAGDDRYLARRYAQGAGIHLAVGVLWDGGGDDEYRSWGVSQGCGHDLAVGVLADGGGSDQYVSTWLSQGVGSADGLGLLLDLAGEDRFVAERDDVQGHGGGGRAQSLGLFMKVGGSATYAGRGRPDSQWDGAEYGGGLDARGLAPGIDTTPRPDPIAAAVASAFSRHAPSGYVRPPDPSFRPRDETARAVQRHVVRLLNPVETTEGQAARADARRELQALGSAAVPALIDLLTATRSEVAFATVDALIALGEIAHPALVDRLGDARWLVRRRAAYVLAQTATPAVARRLAPLAAADSDPVVRAAATDAIGRSPFAGAAAIVADRLGADPDAEVRVVAALASKAVADDAVKRALTRALEDPVFSVRLAARKTLAAIR